MTLEKKEVSFEVKALSDEGKIEGYASVFGELDLVDDIVMPGAFTTSIGALAGKKLPMLEGHNPDKPIGHWFSLSEDQKGLRIQGQINLKTTRGRDMYEHLKAGDVSGLSIGYRTRRQETDDTTGIRKLLEVDLFEVSVVTFPALPSAQAESVKSKEAITMDEARSMSERDIENALTAKQDARPLSRSVARAIMRGGISAIHSTQDAGEEKAVHTMLTSILTELRTLRTDK